MGKDDGPRNTTHYFTLSGETALLNTKIVMEKGRIYSIVSTEEAEGEAEVRANDPISTFGHRGLIAKLGRDGFPIKVDVEKTISSNSRNWGKELYLGWNDSDFLPLNEEEEEPLPFEDLDVTVHVTQSNAPSLFSPYDEYWDSNPATNTTPVFVWDEVEEATAYKVEVSLFPDFRVLEQSITLISTTLDTSIPIVTNIQDITQPTEVRLVEGLHYWRVRAQVNTGRTLSPQFDWTDWSLTYSYGVETRTPLPKPTFLSPESDSEFFIEDTVFFEFTSVPDASGSLWRYRVKFTQCGGLSEESGDVSKEEPTPWYAFQEEYISLNPNQVPLNYAWFYSEPLERGKYVFRVEIRDGADFDENRIAYRDYSFLVECSGVSEEGGEEGVEIGGVEIEVPEEWEELLEEIINP